MNLFSDKFHKFACYLGRHAKHKKMCVCVYAEIFQPSLPRGPVLEIVDENEKLYGQKIDEKELEEWM